jgi:hypothetical protein
MSVGGDTPGQATGGTSQSRLAPSMAQARVLVDELARCGLREAVIAPGSRSAPLGLALYDDPRVRLALRGFPRYRARGGRAPAGGTGLYVRHRGGEPPPGGA